jgi:hypothetical protein
MDDLDALLAQRAGMQPAQPAQTGYVYSEGPLTPEEQAKYADAPRIETNGVAATAPQADDIDSLLSARANGQQILPPQKETTLADHAENLIGGVTSGFADLGNTLLNAGLYLPGKIAPEIKQWNDERNASLQSFNDDHKDSTLFNLSRIGGNIASTWPVGGVLGAGVKAASSAPIVQALGNSIASGGFNTGMRLAQDAPLLQKAGELGIRTLGGGINGGVTTALISPSDAGTGFAIGAALPPAIRGVGYVGNATMRGIRSMTTPQDVHVAKTILGAADATTPEEINAVRAALQQVGPQLLPPDAALTVPHILQKPGVSQLQRTVKSAGDTSLLERETAQNVARLQALNGISPVSGTVQQAAQDFGNQLENTIRPAEKAARENVSALYDAVDPMNQARLVPPIEKMEQAKAQFLGPGTFGSGRSADDAIQTAKTISNYLDTDALPMGAVNTSGQFANPVTFRELQNLRSSIGEAAQQAQANGRNKEFAALSKMVSDIDAGVDAAAQGKGSLQEYFPPDIVQAWRDANAAHAATQLRFRTGPQASMFRMGGDNLPAAQGAELAPKFFNAARSQADDVQAFRRLVNNDPGLVGALKSYAITDLAGQGNRFGTLSDSQFNNWLNGRSGAVNGLFSDSERAVINKIAADLKAADIAENMGRATGSNTVQNAQNALQLGMLDSPVLDFFAKKIPVLNSFTGPALTTLRETARKSKAQALGGLLSNPEAFDTAIGRYLQRQQPGLLGTGFGLLGDATAPALPILYHGAPLLAASP